MLIGYWIKRTCPKIVFELFIGFSFLFPLGHLIHFILIRLMDTSLLYAYKLLFAGGFKHFLTEKHAFDPFESNGGYCQKKQSGADSYNRSCYIGTGFAPGGASVFINRSIIIGKTSAGPTAKKGLFHRTELLFR